MVIKKALWRKLKTKILKAIDDSGVFKGSGASINFPSSFEKSINEPGGLSMARFLIEFELCFRISCLIYSMPPLEVEQKLAAVIENLLPRINKRTANKIKKVIADNAFRQDRQAIINHRFGEFKKRLVESRKALSQAMVDKLD